MYTKLEMERKGVDEGISLQSQHQGMCTGQYKHSLCMQCKSTVLYFDVFAQLCFESEVWAYLLLRCRQQPLSHTQEAQLGMCTMLRLHGYRLNCVQAHVDVQANVDVQPLAGMAQDSEWQLVRRKHTLRIQECDDVIMRNDGCVPAVLLMTMTYMSL